MRIIFDIDVYDLKPELTMNKTEAIWDLKELGVKIILKKEGDIYYKGKLTGLFKNEPDVEVKSIGSDSTNFSDVRISGQLAREDKK